MSEFKLVPDKDRVFTTVEIAEALKTTRPTIYRISSLLNIKCTLGERRVKFWTYADYKKMKEYISGIHKHKPEPVKKPELTLEEMQKLHPLVTNPKWFRLSAFPDIVPKGYEDLAEGVN